MIQTYILTRSLLQQLAGERMKMPRLETKDTIQKCLQHSKIQFWVILNYYKALKTTSLNEIIRGKIAHKNVLSE